MRNNGRKGFFETLLLLDKHRARNSQPDCDEESLNLYLNRLKELMTVEKRISDLAPIYCEYMPPELEPGKLYISKRFQLAIHLCACGCGGKTVTPLGPGEWTLNENDGKITLRPSIGNWSGENPYHAHYYVTENRIDWL